MSRNIFTATWLASMTVAAAAAGGPIPIAEKTVLVYSNEVADGEHQFVMRLARFKPDIFLEWESRDHQGTVHMFRKAVASAEKLTLNTLFDVGSDTEGANIMTKWLSRELYDRFAEGAAVKVDLNRIRTTFTPTGEATHPVRINGKEVEVSGIVIEDSRGGRWVVLRDAENPLILEYSSRHYRESLKSVSTDPRNYLRWIKRLPPVK